VQSSVLTILCFSLWHPLIPNDLASYKLKDDLIELSGALGLQMTGTVVELTAQIKKHLSANLDTQQDLRFSGLFQQGRRRRGFHRVE
jgi:hypothetical protein